MALLETKDLCVSFPIKSQFFKKKIGEVQALKGLNFYIDSQEFVCVVGESGSGKSTLANVLVGLLPATSGEVYWKNNLLKNLQDLNYKKQVQIIFQDFSSSLNSKKNVYEILTIALKVHGLYNNQSKETIINTLKQVELSEELLNRFPHTLSGGQKQRINIARALLLKPRLLICDEISSALDVLVQTKLLYLLKKLQKEEKITLIFITHDLSIARYFGDRIYVMKQGECVEQASAKELFTASKEPYTQKLILSSPNFIQRFR